MEDTTATNTGANTFSDRLHSIAERNTSTPLNRYKLSATLGTIGLLGGIGYGLYKRKGVWGCIGYGFVFSLLGAGAGTVVGSITK